MSNYYELSNKLEGVLEILESILREKLDNYGFYYRIFSRVKSGDSIERKLQNERYTSEPDKKISDLFGLRIILYYQDDIEACQKILDAVLENVRWKASVNDESSFVPSKNNGTFMLPGFVRQIVEPEIEGLRIRPTFEIQLRTVLFEGWHEAEHDMRYKEDEGVWDDRIKEARKLNSILATLEMCDQYMVSLFDDMGHDFYLEKDWARMIRYRYRLRTLNGDIDPDIEALLTSDLGKAVFKWKKKDFIEFVIKENINRLDANTIIYLANEKNAGTPEYVEGISAVYSELRRRAYEKTYPREKLVTPLKMNKAFDVTVVFSDDEATMAEKYQRALEMIYTEFLCRELEEYYPKEFEKPIHEMRLHAEGSFCTFEFEEQEFMMRAMLSYIGMDAPGKVWTTGFQTWIDEGKLMLRCYNQFSNPENAPEEVLPYLRPKLFATIVKKCGAKDVLPITTQIQNVKTIGVEKLKELLESQERRLAVIVITAKTEADIIDQNSCYGHLVDFTSSTKEVGRNNLARKIGEVCHLYVATDEDATAIAKILGEDPVEYEESVRFFARGYTLAEPEGFYRAYSQREILERPKDLYAIRNKKPHYYQTVSGPDAVRHELIEMVYAHVLAGRETKKNW